MEKIKNGKGFYMVLSVLIALGMWVYVRQAVNPDASTHVRNIPVTFVGTDMLDSRQLMIVSGAEQTVTLNVTGKLSTINAIKPEMVRVTLDVSGVTEPGRYSDGYQVSFNLPTGVNGTPAVRDKYPQTISYTVAKEATRSIPVTGSIAGSVEEGYKSGEFQLVPNVLEVKGEASVVNQISHVLVTISEEDMTETFSGELPYTFISYTGEELDGIGLLVEESLIQTTLPILKLKEVPLSVKILPGGGATEDNIDYAITPSTITVAGAPASIDALREISMGSIDLSKVMGSEALTFPVALAADLENVSGISEATVDIKLEGFATETLEAENIELIHIPDGCRAEARTKTKQVQIRGTAEAVRTISPSQIRIVADLDEAPANSGTQTVPVKVYLDGRSDVGVIGEYSIVVSITKR